MGFHSHKQLSLCITTVKLSISPGIYVLGVGGVDGDWNSILDHLEATGIPSLGLRGLLKHSGRTATMKVGRPSRPPAFTEPEWDRKQPLVP